MGDTKRIPEVAAAVLVAAHVLALVSSGAAGANAAAELRRDDRIVTGIVQCYPGVEYDFAPLSAGQTAAQQLALRACRL